MRTYWPLDCNMIRTIWITIACLAVLSAFAVGRAIQTPVALAAIAMDETTVGTSLAQQPLAKADRLEITYVPRETPVQSALPPTEPLIPPAPAIVPPAETKIISRHWHAPNATTSPSGKSKQPAQVATNKRDKPIDPRGGRAVERSKSTGPVKQCDRPGAFGDLLRSLNLSPACVS